ncbi:MAG: hypothetical protein WD638_08655 [Nitriliruptoraceae bacterium]
MRRHLTVLLILGAGLLLAACGTNDPEVIDDRPADEAGDPDASDDGSTDPDDGDPAPGSDSREATIAAADAAERTGVPEEDVEVVRFEMVTWPDGALGCPQPGESYTMALVEGYRLIVEADGEELTYHGALGEDPFHCEDPQEPAES